VATVAACCATTSCSARSSRSHSWRRASSASAATSSRSSTPWATPTRLTRSAPTRSTPSSLIDFIDARGAAELVRRDGLPALIDLLDLDAEVARRAGRPERAARRQRLAMQLRERTLDEQR
jgi:hypothetical protein